MQLPITNDGVRKDTLDHYLYCRAYTPEGEEHASDCVLRKRTVVLEMRVRYVAEVPADWTQDDILFHRNDGSFCLDNDLDQIAGETSVKGAPCLCARRGVVLARGYGAGPLGPWMEEERCVKRKRTRRCAP